MPPSRVRIPPSPLRLTERCPSGLRSATGNRVRAERCVEGSNPSLSATFFLARFLSLVDVEPHGHPGVPCQPLLQVSGERARCARRADRAEWARLEGVRAGPE